MRIKMAPTYATLVMGYLETNLYKKYTLNKASHTVSQERSAVFSLKYSYTIKGAYFKNFIEKVDSVVKRISSFPSRK